MVKNEIRAKSECDKCTSLFLPKSKEKLCELCRQREDKIKKPIMPSPVKDDDNQPPCLECLKNSYGEVIVFQSVCEIEGHAVPIPIS